MKSKSGLLVQAVRPGSAAHRAGVSGGDRIVSVNGGRVSDVIDYMFLNDSAELKLKLIGEGSGSSVRTVTVPLSEPGDPGLQLAHFKVRTCKNKCVFCFVSQLPRGMRKSLYIKDEDYRMSFLYGNYITLCNLTDKDKKRIVEQRLSPLYISVHTTDPPLRRKMLGNPGAPDVMKELKFLAAHKIRMHAQIVLCPGVNDGQELKRTIQGLYSFYPYVQSVAVVPVGLTAYAKTDIRPVKMLEAQKALDAVEVFQRRFQKKHGDLFVYAADEMYIKAGRRFPPMPSYGDLPQVENGVGMVPLFLSQSRRIKLKQTEKQGHTKGKLLVTDSGNNQLSQWPLPIKTRFVTFTGASFYPYLNRFCQRLQKEGLNIRAVAVQNLFFGESVTVAGLLTGADVVRALSEGIEGCDVLLLPDVVLREEGRDVFLDDMSVRDVAKALGVRAVTVASDPDGLLQGIAAAISPSKTA